MNLFCIKAIFSFHAFWHLFPFYYDPLSHGQYSHNKKEKSTQKSNESNKPFNAG